MSQLPLLSKQIIPEQQEKSVQSQSLPISVLQIGEGNFLRGFVDWMIHECQKQGLQVGQVAVTQPRPTGKPKIDALAAQDGLYSLVIRGLENGQPVERKEVISVFADVFDPYSNWDKFLAYGESPDLKVVVSNTTEAGLVYRQEAFETGVPIQSFPGKLTLLLYRRYTAFQGDASKGLILLPCELLERNGDILKACVLQHAEDWNLPEAFKAWVQASNYFLNSLVDRIVTGFPEQAQADEWYKAWGYQDPMLTTAEPYHLWAIENGHMLEEVIPFRQAGLNVHYVDDLATYQLRKVRILNGAHTLMTPLGILHDIEQVREVMEHSELSSFVRAAVEDEILPLLPIDATELTEYSAAVYERFLNPFIKHRLADIAMNSLSKFKVRVLPSILEYMEQHNGQVPSGLARGFAGLLRYYQVKHESEQFIGVTLSGNFYSVRDDVNVLQTIANIWANSVDERTAVKQLLASELLWSVDLAIKYPQLVEQVWNEFAEMGR